MEKELSAVKEKYSNCEEWKNLVYDLVNGTYDLEHYPIEESKYIKNEFAEGEFCAMTYDMVHETKLRIYKKLGVAEDSDVELLIALLEQINHHLAMKMYDYGELFSKKEPMT